MERSEIARRLAGEVFRAVMAAAFFPVMWFLNRHVRKGAHENRNMQDR
jgi:hypothetical protein